MIISMIAFFLRRIEYEEFILGGLCEIVMWLLLLMPFLIKFGIIQ